MMGDVIFAVNNESPTTGEEMDLLFRNRKDSVTVRVFLDVHVMSTVPPWNVPTTLFRRVTTSMIGASHSQPTFLDDQEHLLKKSC